MLHGLKTRVKERVAVQKQKLRHHISRVREKVVYHRRRVKEKIQQMVTHKYFYPILLGSVAVSCAIVFGASASEERGVLDRYCSYDQQRGVHTACGEYDELRTTLERVLPNFFQQTQTRFGNQQKAEQALRRMLGKMLPLKAQLLAQGKMTLKHEITMELVQERFAREVVHLRKSYTNDHSFLLHLRGGGGYDEGLEMSPEGYTFLVVSGGVQQKLYTLHFLNKAETGLSAQDITIQTTTGETFLGIDHIYNVSFLTQSGENIQGEVQATEQKIILHNVSIPTGKSTVSLYGTPKKTTDGIQKVQFTILPEQSVFLSGNTTLTSGQVLFIKNYSYIEVK